MNKQNKKAPATLTGSAAPDRRSALKLFSIIAFMPLTACGQGGRKMDNDIVLDVEMFSYVDRVITDIIFNGTDLGVMNRFGGTGTITGVRIPYGAQTLTWTLGGPKGTPRNGEPMMIKNILLVAPENVPAGTQYAGLHLYPDDTAEITFSEFIPERSARGKQILADRK
ncbi:hypothetical protein [Pseudoduganella lutea]|uniref:DUF3304 domain-containing protein n=1 Tax=Pseudoduganella lutea TaxID=321985 RepID=A0A4P6L2B2_9BURK|nr:hypothetical protein [Pseudoduganella lutea]QBE64928.1 hypothetical protein EWM63_19625 [Pseudoduganella lutea]